MGSRTRAPATRGLDGATAAKFVYPAQSILMPALLAMPFHFANSDAMKAENASGVVIEGAAASLRKLSRSASVCSASLMAALSVATIAGGVLAGATTPKNAVTT